MSERFVSFRADVSFGSFGGAIKIWIKLPTWQHIVQTLQCSAWLMFHRMVNLYDFQHKSLQPTHCSLQKRLISRMFMPNMAKLAIHFPALTGKYGCDPRVPAFVAKRMTGAWKLELQQQLLDWQSLQAAHGYLYLRTEIEIGLTQRGATCTLETMFLPCQVLDCIDK